MATQTLALGYGIAAHPSLTLDIFPLGDDTAIDTGLALVAGANNRQWYEVARTGTESGWHVCVLFDGDDEVADGPFYVNLVNADGTYYLSETPPGDATLSVGERNAIADAYLDRANAVDGKTPRQFMQIVGAVVAGEISGAGEGAGIEVFVGLDGTTVRVTVTADEEGNRTSVIYA